MIALFHRKVKSKETEKRRENTAFPAPKLQYFGENHGKIPVQAADGVHGGGAPWMATLPIHFFRYPQSQ
jgi:hypothetical protein